MLQFMDDMLGTRQKPVMLRRAVLVENDHFLAQIFQHSVQGQFRAQCVSIQPDMGP